jgi:hypothetical protein
MDTTYICARCGNRKYFNIDHGEKCNFDSCNRRICIVCQVNWTMLHPTNDCEKHAFISNQMINNWKVTNQHFASNGSTG